MPKFIVKHLKTGDEQDYDLSNESILIGRTINCEIELPQRSVSRRHCEISRNEQNYFVKDLKSGNGTFLNNKRIKAEEKHLLRSGDTLRIEDYEILFMLGDSNTNPLLEENTDTDILEIKLIKKMMRALDKEEDPSLEILNGKFKDKKILLDKEADSWAIGRDSSCDIPIVEQSLSRTHAKIEKKWGGLVITDLESRNGTFINRKKITEKLLHDGDRLMLGTIKILFRNPKEVNLQIAHQELQRKKREAALEEAEILAKQQEEEARLAEEKAEEEKRRKEEEAKAVEEALEKEAAQEEEEAKEETPAPEEKALQTTEQPTDKSKPVPPPTPKTRGKLATSDMLMIAIGVFVAIAAIVAILVLLIFA